MSQIWFTSDMHFGHDRGFVYEPRGFKSIYENDKAIISRWNEVVAPEDDVYILGDVMLMDNNYGCSCLMQLKGNKYIIRGNHDTDARVEEYINRLWNIDEVPLAQILRYGKYHFYLSHYPTFTASFTPDAKMSLSLINLYGHTHQQTNFFNNNPFMYHVGVDSHNCYPVNIETIIADIKQKCNEVKQNEA